MKKLNRKFFRRDTLKVAQELLGKKIVRVLASGEEIGGIITETEAYLGVKDRACHSYGGRCTKRNEIMYKEGGYVYVYFTYGMHWVLNIITKEINCPEGVMIRGVDKVIGPGRVTKYLQIGKEFYGEDITKSKRIWIEETNIKVGPRKIIKLPRIGIDYAGSGRISY